MISSSIEQIMQQVELVRAVIENKIDDVDRLINEGASADNGLILIAAEKGYVKIVKILLEKFPDLNPAANDNAAIRTAVQNGHLKVVELLRADPRINPADMDNIAVKTATANRNLAMVKCLCADSRVEPAAESNYAVRFAAQSGYLEIVKFLCETGKVNPAVLNNHAIRLAAQNDHVEIVKFLCTVLEVDPSVFNNYAIRIAAQKGYLEMVKSLSTNSKVNPAAYNNHAINLAAKNNHVEVVNFLAADSRVNPNRDPNLATKVIEQSKVGVLSLMGRDLSPGRKICGDTVYLGKVLVGKCNLDQTVKSGDQITIGDLHGNTLKLIYLLVTEGVLLLQEAGKEQDELYAELVKIYDSSPSVESFNRFREIIANAIIPASAKGITLRLLGDDLADRGNNDFLTLLVINKLLCEGSDINLSIIFSNHTAWAVYVYNILTASDNYDDFKLNFKKATDMEFDARPDNYSISKIIPGFSVFILNSMHGLFATLEQGIIDFEEVKALFSSYKKILKLIDYSINNEGELLVYTHAPVDFTDIKKLAVYCGIMDDSEEIPIHLDKVTKLLEEMNFHLHTKLINELRFVTDGGKHCCAKIDNHALTNFIWIRMENHGSYVLPLTVQFVHGHDGGATSQEGFFNLDNLLGKGLDYAPFLKLIAEREYHSYKAYISAKMLSLAETSIADVQVVTKAALYKIEDNRQAVNETVAQEIVGDNGSLTSLLSAYNPDKIMGFSFGDGAPGDRAADGKTEASTEKQRLSLVSLSSTCSKFPIS